jgi:hypothetical protein
VNPAARFAPGAPVIPFRIGDLAKTQIGSCVSGNVLPVLQNACVFGCKYRRRAILILHVLPLAQ